MNNSSRMEAQINMYYFVLPLTTIKYLKLKLSPKEVFWDHPNRIIKYVERQTPRGSGHKICPEYLFFDSSIKSGSIFCLIVLLIG